MANTILEIFLCIIESCCCLIFSDKLLVHRYKHVYNILIAIFVYSFSIYFLSDLSLLIKIPVFIVLGTLLNTFLYKTKFYISSMFFIMFSYIFGITDLIVGNILSVFLSQSILQVYYSNFWQRLLICLLIKLLNVITFYFVYKDFKKIHIIFSRKIYIKFNIVMLTFITMTVLFMSVISEYQSLDDKKYIYLAISILFYIISLLIIHFSSYICIVAEKEEKLSILQKSYASIEENFIIQTENTVKIKELHHDMKSHLSLIASLIEHDKIPEASEIISKAIGHIENLAINTHQTTGNSLVDAIIFSKIALAQKNDVKIKFNLDTIGKTNIEILDISSIISNLLDNSIDAAIKSEERIINIKIFTLNKYLVINVENSYTYLPDTKPGESKLLITSKEDKSMHGFGLQIIKELSEKYNGDFTWKATPDKFISNVILKL